MEVKSGRTPAEPYRNHVAQLTAYCLLVHETYGTRPSHGIVKYPEREFVVPYTNENERWVRELVGEMLAYKSGGELVIAGDETGLCRGCRSEGSFVRGLRGRG